MLLLFSPQPTIHDAVQLTSGRAMTRLAQTQWYADQLLTELAKECENGRLLRLLVKLCHVADRPELDGDAGWGEHSDRHLMRLYRDSVFHQTDENGAASLDFAQVVAALNRLDMGAEAKTLLTSNAPGQQGELLLVSSREVKGVLERSFGLVASKARSRRSSTRRRSHQHHHHHHLPEAAAPRLCGAAAGPVGESCAVGRCARSRAPSRGWERRVCVVRVLILCVRLHCAAVREQLR